jgi:UDP-glucose:(heptosyl)LPS alpha-1,3-glucosyltransferase
MKIALCYESVLPSRGGCETYIVDLARRLLAEGHVVELYACRWDEQAVPAGVRTFGLPAVSGPRFVRPWRFGALCEQALTRGDHDVSLGFNKTWGQDVLYPQGGLHTASFDHNLVKVNHPWMRQLVAFVRGLDLAHRSFVRLERKQYLSQPRPLIIVNSNMVRRHFQQYYGIPPEEVFVVRSAIDPQRFCENDRLRRRLEDRQRWCLDPEHVVGLFAAMNYRLKGLEPLLHSVRLLLQMPEFRPAAQRFRLLVAGHPRYGHWQRLANRLGIGHQVQFIGHCPDMKRAYFAADFLVHPTFYDPCSLVVLEALACSLPVITTRANGASELLHPLQEGYVIDNPHQHEHLAWGIGQLLDPDRRKAFAAAARRTALQWTFDHHYRALVQVLERAAARRQAA